MVTTRLSGIVGVLDWRDLEFMEAIPSWWTCKLCGAISRYTLLLPCSHEFCEVCNDQITAKGQRCPLDGCEYTVKDVKRLVVNPVQLGERVARCVNFSRGCNFQGPVRKVKQHFQDGCSFNTVTCVKCKREVLRKEYLEHFLSYCPGYITPTVNPTSEDSNGSVQKAELATLQISDSRKDAQDDVNSLLERIATFTERVKVLEDTLSRKICETLPTRRRSSTHLMVQGRSTIKSASCCIGGFYCRETNVSTSHTTKGYSQSVMVAGYTLKVSSDFQFEDNCTWLSLSLMICEGPFDSFVSWPFRKNCSVVLVHPIDSRKNVRRPVSTELMDNRCYRWFRKPKPGQDNEEFGHQLFDSKEVEFMGFVVNDSICVSIEVE
ncbi:hypothetical protein ISCGN_005925 [Ixodes scapularis]